MTVTSTPAGFYPDPLDPYSLRYWDGTTWTEHKAPLYLQQAVAAPPDALNIEGGRRFVGPFRALFLGFRQYAKFTGRSSRSEYWWWTMWTYVAFFGAQSIFFFERAARGFNSGAECATFDSGIRNPCESSAVFWTGATLTILFILVLVAMVVPTIAVLVRRLHDGGFSGLFALLMLGGILWVVGIIAYIAIWVLACFPSKAGNQYGPRPTKGKPRSRDVVTNVS